MMTASEDHAGDSLPTLAAMGALAYVCCDLVHELVGHGGACLATGGHPATFSTVHFQCFGGWQRLISAAGIVMNIVAGVIFWVALRRTRRASTHVRYFLWLGVGFNLFSGWGYVVQSSLTGSGDVANALSGLPAAAHWRLGLGALGVLGYAVSVVMAATYLRAFSGPGSRARAWRIILVPYFAAGAVASIAGVLNSVLPVGQALTAAVGSSLGNWGFLFLPFLRHVGRRPQGDVSATTAPVTRSLPWILAAAVLIFVFVAVLGPGVMVRAGR